MLGRDGGGVAGERGGGGGVWVCKQEVDHVQGAQMCEANAHMVTTLYVGTIINSAD